MGLGSQSHVPDALLRTKKSITHFTAGWVGHKAGLDGCVKSRTPQTVVGALKF